MKLFVCKVIEIVVIVVGLYIAVVEVTAFELDKIFVIAAIVRVSVISAQFRSLMFRSKLVLKITG